MRTISKILFVLLCVSQSFAQTKIPQLANFSAIVRDANDNPVTSTLVDLRLTFKQGASYVYCAQHQTTTSPSGYVSIQLNRNVLSTNCNGSTGTFDNIKWEDGEILMEVEYKKATEGSYTQLGQIELASTFYAFASETTEKVKGFDLAGAIDGSVIRYDAASGLWKPYFSASAPGNNVNVIPRIATQEQRVTVSFTGGNDINFSQSSSTNCPDLWASANLFHSASSTVITPKDVYFIDEHRFDVIYDIPWFVPADLYDIIIAPGTACEHIMPASFKIVGY